MVAISLGATRALQYSVIGQDASGVGDVRHVGILFDHEDLEREQHVYVFEMTPPLCVGTPIGKMVAHAVGYLDLTPDERRGILLWLTDLQTRSVKCAYHVLPATQGTVDPGTRRAQYTSFSCAGFVASCYRDGARVSLVVEEAKLPEVERDLTAQIWERPFLHYPKERRDALMARLGLRGSGPWRVLLPGYLLHALNRARPALPYAPDRDSWHFP
jgi:hypothetical protein